MKENEFVEKIVDEEMPTLKKESDAITSSISIRTFRRLIQEYLDKIYLFEREEYRPYLEKAISDYVNGEYVNADETDFHNLAVDLARHDEYLLAISILSFGLKFYPRDVDLLADYLSYGVKCHRWNECKDYYDTLKSVPMVRWGWRAFSFSIDYLIAYLKQNLTPEEDQQCIEEMNQLSTKYLEYLPDNEDCYVSLYDVNKSQKKHEVAIRYLKDGLEKLKIAPKCALKYADESFNKGNFAEALPYIQRGIKDSAQTQSGVNLGYLYYLSGLCKISLSQQNGGKLQKTEVLEIYCDFNIAARELKGNEGYRKTIKSQTLALIDLSHIDIPRKANNIEINRSLLELIDEG